MKGWNNIRKVILLLLAISCSLNNKTIINADFEKLLENYIENNPIPKYLESNEEGKFAIPSYHLYFGKKESDSIIQIKLLPFLVGFNPLNSKIDNEGEEIITEENPDGYFVFREKLIVVFDKNNYGINIIDGNKLIKKIPDSLKWDFNKHNNHIRSKSNYYNISKQKIEIIE
ncbi:hypothetical protein CW731_05455 [Polaribacter sp. ALD11]|nr:hypothetical protein CW731_05455 [Polaribacter sp. ALD11]